MFFDVLHAASNDRYADGYDIRLVNVGPVALFTNYMLTTSSGKHLEEISHAHIVSLMYKPITSATRPDDLSIGFDRNRSRRQRELTNNKNIKGIYHIKNCLKDNFAFAEHQEKATLGLGCKLTLARNVDNSVLKEDNAINIGKNKIISIEWFVPHLKASVSQQAI